MGSKQYHCMVDFHTTATGRLKNPKMFKDKLKCNLKFHDEICIYIIYQNNKLLYVGSSKNMAKRLKNGLNAINYKYKWQKGNTKYRGIFFSFPNIYNSTQLKKIREALESEVVLYIRNRTKDWPLKQHEIHFQPGITHDKKNIKKYYQYIINNISGIC